MVSRFSSNRDSQKQPTNSPLKNTLVEFFKERQVRSTKAQNVDYDRHFGHRIHAMPQPVDFFNKLLKGDRNEIDDLVSNLSCYAWPRPAAKGARWHNAAVFRRRVGATGPRARTA